MTWTVPMAGPIPGPSIALPIAGTLNPDKQNARVITEEALAGLSVSVEEFGDLSGIVWNERTGELVCGHQRVETLRRAGAVEWHRETGTTDRAWIVHPKTGARFPIRIVDWDPMRQRMANLVANNTAIAGEFTPEALDQLNALEKSALFEATRLGALERELAARLGGWDSDISEVEKHGENTDGINARVVVTCPQDLRETVTDLIRSAVSNLEGVVVG